MRESLEAAVPLLGDWLIRARAALANREMDTTIRAGAITSRVCTRMREVHLHPQPLRVFLVQSVLIDERLPEPRDAEHLQARFITICDTLCPREWAGVFVENVFSTRLLGTLINLGYVPGEDPGRVQGLAPSLFKARSF